MLCSWCDITFSKINNDSRFSLSETLTNKLKIAPEALYQFGFLMPIYS